MAQLGGFAKFRKKKRRLSKAERIKKKRAEKAAIRHIAKLEGITQKEARRLYWRKDAVIEVLFKKPQAKIRRRFLEVTPLHFREVPPGRPMRQVEAVGPIKTVNQVSRIIKLQQYWALVDILKAEMKLSTAEIRKRIKEGRIGIWDLYEGSQRTRKK